MTFTVDEARRAFTWAVEEPGAPVARVSGGEGQPLAVNGRAAAPAETERRRRELVVWLDAQIERLEGVAGAEADVKWMRRFRAQYATGKP